jgi:hypothetical protein
VNLKTAIEAAAESAEKEEEIKRRRRPNTYN